LANKSDSYVWSTVDMTFLLYKCENVVFLQQSKFYEDTANLPFRSPHFGISFKKDSDLIQIDT